MSQKLTTPTPPQEKDLRWMLKSDAVRDQIALALPKHMTPDRMLRVALTTVNTTPKLLDCSKESVLSAIMKCSAIGLEPDGRNAHLIPYGSQCQLIIDYKGLVALAERNGVQNIRAASICENDEFSFSVENGVIILNHKIDWKKPRGDAYAYYASCVRNGMFDAEVMQRDEINAIRKRSKASGAGPWVTDFDEMAKKTVLRRMSKRWDITPELKAALDADDDRIENIRDITPRKEAPKFLDAPEDTAIETTSTEA